ncbi:hypothetical protein E3N88_23333 [Mikania micrantha]|uniref:Reverse transcriptase/retrotransposon-derived protein RNase H-like domain-containing protein n=1 Tax=Mikania micrantha TaxID=192012 RepID=A0A5N6ND17_9ASTR|nr:hypothetical protein E3N88_23333 [Mikania micrantha]
MRQHKLMGKRSKYTFGGSKVEYLGHIISKEGVSMDDKKIEAIVQWPIPTTVKQLRGFLGLAGYYRGFIHSFGSIAKPLTDFLKKDYFCWIEDAQIAIKKLKVSLSSAPYHSTDYCMASMEFTSSQRIKRNSHDIGWKCIMEKGVAIIAVVEWKEDNHSEEEYDMEERKRVSNYDTPLALQWKKHSRNSLKPIDIANRIKETTTADRMFQVDFIVLMVTTMISAMSSNTINREFLTSLSEDFVSKEFDWCEYVLLYCDRVSVMLEPPVERNRPVIAEWKGKDLKRREEAEIGNGGYGLGELVVEWKKTMQGKQYRRKVLAEHGSKDAHFKGCGCTTRVLENDELNNIQVAEVLVSLASKTILKEPRTIPRMRAHFREATSSIPRMRALELDETDLPVNEKGKRLRQMEEYENDAKLERKAARRQAQELAAQSKKTIASYIKKKKGKQLGPLSLPTMDEHIRNIKADIAARRLPPPEVLLLVFVVEIAIVGCYCQAAHLTVNVIAHAEHNLKKRCDMIKESNAAWREKTVEMEWMRNKRQCRRCNCASLWWLWQVHLADAWWVFWNVKGLRWVGCFGGLATDWKEEEGSCKERVGEIKEKRTSWHGVEKDKKEEILRLIDRKTANSVSQKKKDILAAAKAMIIKAIEAPYHI